MLTKSWPSLLPVITDIVNQNSALIIPLLKRTNLNNEDFKNFRSVSNLSFISNLIEKSIAAQHVQYMTTTTLVRNYNLLKRNCTALRPSF